MTHIIHGLHPIYQALKAHRNPVKKIIISRGNTRRPLKEILRLAAERGISIQWAGRDNLTRMAKTTSHQGIVAQMDEFKYVEVSDIVQRWEARGDKAFLLIVDGVEDPQNLGGLIRTAHAFGVHGIVIPKDRATPITPTVIKASVGAAFHTPIARVTNIASCLEFLKKRGIWILGAEGGSERPIYDCDLDLDLAVVIGSEGRGIRPLVKKKCDFLASIPLHGEITSLNASVAGALVMYEVLRGRLPVKGTHD
ncbi:MAG: 23S rRNA (guanosine(2251)-2'-O)-methyltransferase RlmB [Syntrophobacterales bacterium]|nr:MAG: 23S rRNA (guanosine(2251)-2'-O)-methyltransferase RlmB [Syntrophobacterales bacterium]